MKTELLGTNRWCTVMFEEGDSKRQSQEENSGVLLDHIKIAFVFEERFSVKYLWLVFAYICRQNLANISESRNVCSVLCLKSLYALDPFCANRLISLVTLSCNHSTLSHYFKECHDLSGMLASGIRVAAVSVQSWEAQIPITNGQVQSWIIYT